MGNYFSPILFPNADSVQIHHPTLRQSSSSTHNTTVCQENQVILNYELISKRFCRGGPSYIIHILSTEAEKDVVPAAVLDLLLCNRSQCFSTGGSRSRSESRRCFDWVSCFVSSSTFVCVHGEFILQDPNQFSRLSN